MRTFFVILALEIDVFLLSGLLFAAEMLKLNNLMANGWAYEESIRYLLRYPLIIPFLLILATTILNLFLLYVQLKREDEKI